MFLVYRRFDLAFCFSLSQQMECSAAVMSLWYEKWLVSRNWPWPLCARKELRWLVPGFEWRIQKSYWNVLHWAWTVVKLAGCVAMIFHNGRILELLIQSTIKALTAVNISKHWSHSIVYTFFQTYECAGNRLELIAYPDTAIVVMMYSQVFISSCAEWTWLRVQFFLSLPWEPLFTGSSWWSKGSL